MRDDEEKKDARRPYYDVAKFKDILEKQPAPLSRARRIVRRVWNQIDSLGGFFITAFAMALIFVAPLFVVIMALLYRLPGFILAYAVTAGSLTLYVKRRVGKSVQFSDGSLGTKLLLSVIGYSLVVAVFYFIFYIILGRKLS